MAFLFTDLAGSSRMWEAFPEAMETALADHDAILGAGVENHGGDLFATMGDGVAAAFATVDDAVASAIDIQAALRAHRWGDTGGLRVRMGIHVGAARRRGSDYFGPTLNRCARLMAVGHGGQVLVSGGAREALTADVALRDLGMHRLRDLSAPEHIYQLATPDLDGEFPPLVSLDAHPGNLPLQATTFVGRHDDVTDAVTAMERSRVLTLAGVGGVGKTRLALQIAAEVSPRFRDGVWLCELAPIGDPAAVPHAVAALFGVQPEADRSVADAVIARFATGDMLLILDNCEHLLDAVCAFVEDVVRACAGVVILATSREPLGVTGEVIRAVRALDTPSAVQLFVDRATAVRSDFALGPANEAAVSEICRRLDGVPLALELAAARVASMSPGEIALRLDERFRLLTGGRRRAVERHRTLRGTVDWSFGLLEPVEQRVFSRLAVFSGGFALDAAEAVMAEPVGAVDIVDVIDGLVHKSMVVAEEHGVVTRYSMLETLRQYAEEQLAALDEGDTTRQRHGVHFAALAERGRVGTSGPDEAEWVETLELELDNFRAAWSWATGHGETDVASRLIAALANVAFMHLWSEFNAWASATVDLLRASPGDVATSTAAVVYAAAAEHAWPVGAYDRARGMLEEALALPGLDDAARGELYKSLLNVLLITGNLRGAISAGEVSVAALRAGGQPWLLAVTTADLAICLAAAGRGSEGVEQAEAALEQARGLANPTAIGWALYALGESLLDIDAERAAATLENAISALEAVDNGFILGVARVSLVSALGRSEYPRRAAQGYLDLLQHWSVAGNRAQQWVTLRNAAELLARCGEPEVTAAMYGAMATRGTEPPEGSPEASRLDSAVGAAARALGDRFDATVEHGASLSDDDLVTQVRQALERMRPAE